MLSMIIRSMLLVLLLHLSFVSPLTVSASSKKDDKTNHLRIEVNPLINELALYKDGVLYKNIR